MSPRVARVLTGVSIFLLLAFAWLGLTGGVHQLANGTNTFGQQVESVTQLSYGVLSLAGIGVWFWARRWSRIVFVFWVLSVATAGGLAPVVWGDASLGVGFLTGAASLLVAWGIVWLLPFSSRRAAS